MQPRLLMLTEQERQATRILYERKRKMFNKFCDTMHLLLQLERKEAGSELSPDEVALLEQIRDIAHDL